MAHPRHATATSAKLTKSKERYMNDGIVIIRGLGGVNI